MFNSVSSSLLKDQLRNLIGNKEQEDCEDYEKEEDQIDDELQTEESQKKIPYHSKGNHLASSQYSMSILNYKKLIPSKTISISFDKEKTMTNSFSISINQEESFEIGIGNKDLKSPDSSSARQNPLIKLKSINLNLNKISNDFKNKFSATNRHSNRIKVKSSLNLQLDSSKEVFIKESNQLAEISTNNNTNKGESCQEVIKEEITLGERCKIKEDHKSEDFSCKGQGRLEFTKVKSAKDKESIFCFSSISNDPASMSKDYSGNIIDSLNTRVYHTHRYKPSN